MIVDKQQNLKLENLPTNSTLIDLSNYELHSADFQKLNSLLSDSLYLEELRLPKKIQENELSTLLETLNNLTKKSITLKHIGLEVPTNLTVKDKFLLNQINSRLNRNRENIFGIHGGGNIGLCLMAYVASNSTRNFKIVATTPDQLMTRIVNSNNKVYFQLTNPHERNFASNVTMVGYTREPVLNLYTNSVMVAICVTADVMKIIAQDVARGLIQRFEKDQSALKILVLMNRPNCGEFAYETIHKAMLQVTNENSEYTNNVLSNVEFVACVIDRITNTLSVDEVKRQIGEELVEHGIIKESEFSHHHKYEEKVNEIINTPGELEKLISTYDLKINLFKTEKKFAFYVSNDFKEKVYFPLIKPTNNLKLITDIKNKCINGSHAILAWLGALEGATTIAEAINKPHLEKFINELLEEEIKPLILKEYPSLMPDELNHFCDEFIERCKESIDDPIIRVGRDPLRKLNAGGRIRGLIEIAQETKMQIKFDKLEFGIAAGYLYGLKDIDPENPSCIKIKEIFNENGRDYKALLCYSGEEPSGNFIGFNPSKDQAIIDNIIQKIKILEDKFEKRKLSEKHQETHEDEVIAKLNTLGIKVDKQTGHLSYLPSFSPLKLDYELVFIRHGETYGNCGQSDSKGKINQEAVKQNIKDDEKRIFEGRNDDEINQLTKTGRAQARLLVSKLDDMLIKRKWIPDAILLSPLKRADETAQPFISKYNLQKICSFLNEIKEMSFGYCDNRRVCDVDEKDECHLYYKDQNALVKKSGIDLNGKFQDAESFCDVLLRAHNILLKLNDVYKGKKVIMFSHSLFGAACCILLGKGQTKENESYLAFDGKKSDGSYYTMPHVMPFVMNFDIKST